VKYQSGVEGKIDLGPLIADGDIWDNVRNDDDLFKLVRIDAFGSLCWPDGADIAPELLWERVTEKAVVAG
jgi:hypothetical protein